MSYGPEDARAEPLITCEPAPSYRRCLCCLGEVKWAIIMGTREPYATNQVAICASCAKVLAPIVDKIARESDAADIDNPHPDGCFSDQRGLLRDCRGDGHYECRRCTRKETP